MLDPLARRLIDPPLARLAARVDALGIRADALSWGGFALGLAAAAAVAAGAPLAGLALFLLNRLADGLDGAVARRSRATDLGGYLDIVLDFIVYGLLAFAFALAEPGNAPYAAFLAASFMGTASSFLAYAVIAAKRGVGSEARGRKSFYHLGGLTEGTETILFFALCCLLPRAFPLLASIFAALCWITTAGRIHAAMRDFA